MIGYTPQGPTMFRNPPAQHFKPPQNMDLPLFAHDGRGKSLVGEWTNGKHGEQIYNTELGSFQHGIDALASHIGDFLQRKGINRNPVDVINQAIKQFNATHTDKAHQLPMFDNMAWRKLRAGMLPPGDGDREEATRPTRTHNNTLITTYTNKNYQDTPMGRFMESYAIPFHQQLQHVLEDEHGVEQEEWKQMPFVKYPYMYAHYTVPNVIDENGNVRAYVRSNHREHPGQVTSQMMGGAPDDYFGDMQDVHTWETLHHLPDIFFYPKLNQHGKKGGKIPTGLYQAAHSMIDQVMDKGIEHIPNINVTYNQSGKLTQPDMVQRPLREVLQTPDMREALIKDLAHAPAMMYLFGRSFQGDFKNLYNLMMENYGTGEDGISHEDHMRFLQPGEKGGKGLHTTAGKIMALARKSGVGENENRSKFGDHQITSEELETLGIKHHNETALGQVDRYRGIIEALADHQASARGHNVKMGIGDIPTEPMQNLDIFGYPQLGDEASLEPHMDAYFHDLSDYAASEGMPVPPQSTPPASIDALPSSAGDAGMSTPVSRPLPVSQTGGTPLPPSPAVAVRRPPRPIDPAYQAYRPNVASLDPTQFRQLVGLRPGGEELTEFEQAQQRAIADPRQQLITQYMKSEDSHLSIMDRTLKALERMQFHEASLDNSISHGAVFSNIHQIAKHVGLTSGEVNSINESMGDWHKIAKAYHVQPKVVKVIKLNMK